MGIDNADLMRKWAKAVWSGATCRVLHPMPQDSRQSHQGEAMNMFHLQNRPEFYDGTLWDLPIWAEYDAVFGLKGKAWRILAVGSHNNTPGRKRFVKYVHAEPLKTSDAWAGLPDAPCAKADIAESLAGLYATRRFTPDELVGAIHIESES